MLKRVSKIVRVVIMAAVFMLLFQVPVFAAGGTTVRNEDGNMIFQVGDGYNLDQVVNRRTNPYYVYFNIDMQGMQVKDDVILKLKCYDVDSGPEVDNVYVNGNMVGILTGANESWSTVTLPVKAEYLKPGKNYIQVDVDCQLLGYWVKIDYAEIILPVQVGEVSAESQGTDWEMTEVMNKPLLSAPSENKDIIGKINSKIPYNFKADCLPEGHRDTIAPKIETNWTIYDPEQKVVKSGSNVTEGWDGNIYITAPNQVGKYTLKVDSTIYATGESWLMGAQDKKKMSVQTETYTLYSVLDKAENYKATTGEEIACNEQKWLELGTQMAQGAKNKNEVAENITKAIHENSYGWTFGYYEDGSKDNVEALFDGNGEKRTDSYVFNDALNVLANAVGLKTLVIKEDTNVPYLTKSEYTSLDGNKGANALENGSDVADRWYLTEHAYSMIGKRVFDPVFGIYKSTNKQENVYAKMIGLSGEGEILLETLDGAQTFVLEEQDTEELGWSKIVWGSLIPME